MITKGSLIYLKIGEKKRPHICVYLFTNKAGVTYDYLLIPITTSGVVGEDNLIQVKHPKLKKNSWAKLNNAYCISEKANMDICDIKFKKKYVDAILARFNQMFIQTEFVIEH